MRKALLAVLVMGLMAGSANAVTLSLEWPGGASSTDVNPGGTATFEVWLRGIPQDFGFGIDRIHTVFFEYQAEPQLSTTAAAASQGGWSSGSVFGPMGGIGVQFAVGSDNPLSNNIQNATGGPIDVMVGTQTVMVDAGATESDILEIVMAGPSVNILGFDNNGDVLTYAYNHAQVLLSYSGVYNYGTGGPQTDTGGKTPVVIQPRNPLTIHVLPEPASLALLALGGIAVLRRR